MTQIYVEYTAREVAHVLRFVATTYLLIGYYKIRIVLRDKSADLDYPKISVVSLLLSSSFANIVLNILVGWIAI